MDWLELGLYLMIYSFFGWCIEVVYYAVAKRTFRNRGFLTLPFLLSYGAAFDLMLLALPALTGRYVMQFLFTMAAMSVAESVADHLNRQLGPNVDWGEARSRLLGGSLRGLISSALIAGACYAVYLMVHPLVLGLMALVPTAVKRAVLWALLALMEIGRAHV